MSRTVIYGIFPGTDKRCEKITEFHNSWHGAPLLWEHIGQKHLGWEPYTFIQKVMDGDQGWKEAVALVHEGKLPEYINAPYMMTWDRCYVSSTNYKRLATDIRRMVLDMPAYESGHWTNLALFLDPPVAKPKAANEGKVKFPSDYPGIGIHWTTVSENLFCGEWNESIENYDHVNWDNFFECYEEIKSIRSEK